MTVRNQLIGMQFCLLSVQQENLELKNAMNSIKVYSYVAKLSDAGEW